MNIFETTIGAIHTIFAVIALISGGYVVATTKGIKIHKYIGYVYVINMILMNVTGLFTQVLFKFGPFHFLAILSLLTVLTGIAAPVFFRRYSGWLRIHYSGMSWSYVGLWAAFAAEIIVRLPLSGTGVTFWQAVIFASFLVTFIGGYYIKKYEPGMP